jgi:hypothetical protein
LIAAGRRRGLASLACAAVVALGAILAPGAGAEVEPESRPESVAVGGSSGVGAILSYREGVGGNLPYFDLNLHISQASGGVYEEPVSSHFCLEGCVPAPVGGGVLKESPLNLADLEGNGQTEVVLELSTGGAHCCTVLQVFSFDATAMTWRPVERDFGDPLARLSYLVGTGATTPNTVFTSADDRFAYAFTSYAFSGLPIQIWRFTGGHFENVTKDYPRQIAADAARQFKGFVANRKQGLGLGLIAAWAADEQLLGHRALLARTLAREAGLHRLHSRETPSLSGGAFIKRLNRFLKRNGYA